MNLQGDFFKVTNIHAESNLVKATVELNPLHQIFEGHFPGLPVVPGVCMMQMVKELVETVTGNKTMLSKADMMKFLVIINPLENRIVDVELKYKANEMDRLEVNASIMVGTAVCFKFKGLFIPE